jgi:very-short-patch-repair endonuclease
MANAFARQLRKQMTPQEVKLWVRLRQLREFGLHFRRQSPIDNYIVDFVCFGSRVIVEVDGGQHAIETVRDQLRDAHFSKNGFRVLRFWNSEVDANLDCVVETNVRVCEQSPTPARFARRPSPQGGGIDREG